MHVVLCTAYHLGKTTKCTTSITNEESQNLGVNNVHQYQVLQSDYKHQHNLQHLI